MDELGLRKQGIPPTQTPDSGFSAQPIVRAQRPQGRSTGSVLASKNHILRRKQRSSQAAEMRVLHVGCGSNTSIRLHPIFQLPQWSEVRVDIDESTRPDIIGSLVELEPWVENESCDAIWASHVLEHLSRHELPKALNEFRRVLVPTGFALVRVPDIETVAQYILDGRICDVIYTSPAGPITPLDMLYGHGASIERGHHAMRHGTAFTQDLLAQVLLDAGFVEVRTSRTETHEVWALALMPASEVDGILCDLASTGLNLRDDASHDLQIQNFPQC